MNKTIFDDRILRLNNLVVPYHRRHTVNTQAHNVHMRAGRSKNVRVLTIICLLATLVPCLCTAPPPGYAQKEEQHHGISVAVLPFEVFSIEKEPTLGSEIAAFIAKQLALNPAIVCIKSQQINEVLRAEDYPVLDKERLRHIAKLLNANCIIMGTVTKIRTEHSIDVEMFTTATNEPNFKTFSEGIEIKSLTESIVTVLDQEIMQKAHLIPAAERPRVSTGRQPTTQTPSGGFDVERELIAAFGPMEEKSKQPAAAQPKAAADTTRTASALTEETIPGELHTETLPEAAPSTVPPEGRTAAAAGSKEPRRKTPTAPATDSAFFSLSKAISINSDSMEYDNRANMALFKGNVVARQDDIVMFANSMRVYYSGGGGLARVEAQGNVRVVQGDRIATGGSIVFNNATQTIVATGNPRVWQGDNVVHGMKITVYLKEERTVVEGEPNSRASATIYPDSTKKRP